MIAPFEYCSKCGLVYCYIQNIDCVVCHGELVPIEGLLIPERACPVCFGDKYLLHNDGLMHPCPSCKGTGKSS